MFLTIKIGMVNMFNERLRGLRKKENLTMKELGKKFNLAESTISGYENGKRKPDMELIQSFADFFGVSTDYLLGRSNNYNFEDKEEFDSLAEINRLIKEYGIEQSGFFDIEKWKAMGPEEIKQLESYFQFLVSESQKHNKQ